MFLGDGLYKSSDKKRHAMCVIEDPVTSRWVGRGRKITAMITKTWYLLTSARTMCWTTTDPSARWGVCQVWPPALLPIILLGTYPRRNERLHEKIQK